MEIYDAPGAAFVTVNSTTIIGGADTRVLFDDGGKIGENAGLTFTKATGILAATVGAFGGATPGTNALAVTGTANISGTTTFQGSVIVGSTGGSLSFANNSRIDDSPSGGIFRFQNTGGAATVTLNVNTTANLQLGGAAVDTAPVAQTLSVQNTLAGGTSNVAGAAFTIAGSQGKGTGVGGNIVIQTAPAGTTGTTVNPLATALTAYGSGDVGIGTGTAIATTATAGFLLISTCAGTPTGAPPNAGTGKAALIFDTTNSQLWISVSGASWKQPKTPAAAATITWQ